MALSQLQEHFDAALGFLPQDTLSFVQNKDFPQTTLNQVFGNDDVFNTLKSLLYGDNTSGYVPRLKNSFKFSLAQIQIILDHTKRLTDYIKTVDQVKTLEDAAGWRMKLSPWLRKVDTDVNTLRLAILNLPNQTAPNADMNLLKPDVRKAVSDEIINKPVFSQISAKWVEFHERSISLTSWRVKLETEWEDRRWSPSCPKDKIREFGKDEWLTRPATLVREEKVGDWWQLNIRQTQYYNKEWQAGRTELMSENGIVMYARRVKPAAGENGKIVYPEQRDLSGIDNMIDELYKKKTDRKQDWEKYYVDFAAKQNAVSKSIRSWQDQEKEAGERAAALKKLYNGLCYFIRHIRAVMGLLEALTLSITKDLYASVREAWVFGHACQAHLWAEEDGCAMASIRDTVPRLKNIETWYTQKSAASEQKLLFAESGILENERGRVSGYAPRMDGGVVPALCAFDVVVGNELGVGISHRDKTMVTAKYGNTDLWLLRLSSLSFTSIDRLSSKIRHGFVNDPATKTRGAANFLEWDVTYWSPYPAGTGVKAHAWLSGFYLDKDSSFDLTVTVRNVTTKGCTIHVDKHSSMKIKDLTFNWIAYSNEASIFSTTGADTDHLYKKPLSDTQDTPQNRFDQGELYQINSPRSSGWSTDYSKMRFQAPPAYVACLRRLKFDTRKNLRVSLEVFNHTRDGCDMRVGGWHDTRMHEVEFTVLFME